MFDADFLNILAQQYKTLLEDRAREETERRKKRGKVFRSLMASNFYIGIPSDDDSLSATVNGITFTLSIKSYGHFIDVRIDGLDIGCVPDFDSLARLGIAIPPFAH